MRDAVSTRALGRVFWLRALVVASLLGVAAVIGWWAYTILRESESTQADSLYESVSVAALVNTQKSFTRASKGATTLASMFSGAHPTETDWPNAALGEFAERAAQLAEIANVNDVGFGPVLRPDQVAAWETFAFNLWDNDPLIPPNRAFTPPAGPGLPPGRGIWNINPNIPPPGSIYLDDLSGNTTWGDSDTLRILLPTAQHKGENLLGLNSYPSQVLGPVIEKTLLCAMEKDIGAARTECQAVVTLPQGIVKAFSDYKAPALVVLTPISIVGDDGATKAVGIAYASLDWSILLADTVPSFVGELDIVLEAEGATGGEKVLFTFVFKKGDNGLALALWQGNGDLHDPRYSSKRKTGLLYQPSLVGIAESSQYTISFYPRKAFYDKYQSNSPIYFSVGGVSLIALVSLIFLLYDFAVSRQSEEQKVVLDTKRRYVRFISHEIRTPLNTVRMGLKLFDMELVSSLKMLKEKSPAEAVLIMTKTIEGWAQLTDDTLSNTEAAVDVLNDLLNYDKV
ncbi:hypothetical protein B484DRAFT_389004 [Ochromonadaceae sp. CCMP2298]|nr:hypothetical protein B484DRAFT_389004 [Ochromonadaceae sp. CCMP2298]